MALKNQDVDIGQKPNANQTCMLLVVDSGSVK
jgi:hypothetical protein